MKLKGNQGVFFIASIFLMAVAAFMLGSESRIFGARYFFTGVRYDVRLDVLLVSLIALSGILLYRVIKNNAGISFTDGSFFQKHLNKLLVLSLVLISGTNFTGGFKSNYPRVWNTALFGTKADGVTDDTQAIQATTNACANAGGGEVYLLNGVYNIAGAIQTNIGGIDMNCQIYIPITSTNLSAITINFVGESSASPGNMVQSPFGSTGVPNMGVTLYSSYTGTRSTTNKGTAIIGTSENSPGAFNSSSFTLEKINFKAKFNPNGAGPEIGGANGKNALGFSVYNCTYTLDTSASAFLLPTRDISGFETPENNGGASYVASNTSVAGTKWGFIFGEHVSGNQVSAFECYYGFGIKPGNHASTFQRLNAYWCTYGINWYQFGASPTTIQPFTISEYDVEFGVGNAGKYYNTVYTLVDSTNKFQANINYTVITQSVGINNANWLTNGGSGVRAMPIGTNAGGSTTQIQYDSLGALSGSANMVYNPSTGHVIIGGGSPVTDDYDLNIIKSQSSQIGASIQNTNPIGQTSVFIKNNRNNDSSYGFISYGGATNASGNLFGANRQDAFNILQDGISATRFNIGTLTAIPLTLGTANTNRFQISGTGDFTFAIGKMGITEGTNGRVGQVALVAGTKAITISGLTTSSRAFISLVTPNTATSTIMYQGVCTANTLTIQANVAAGTINNVDVSTVNYFIINSMNDWLALAIVLGLIRPLFRRRSFHQSVYKQAA